MNREEFYLTLQNDDVPEDLYLFLQALWYDKRGNWDKAHDSISEIEDNNAYTIHAYLHRKEGDIQNAKYWYNRAGRAFPDWMTFDQEWEQLVLEMTDDDFWETYQKRISEMSDEQLIDAFNHEVGINAWTNKRAFYLSALKDELTSSKRKFKNTSIIADSGGFSLKKKVKLEGKKIVIDDRNE